MGGEQEKGMRGGTENVPGIVGLGTACEQRQKILPQAIEHLKHLRDRFEEILLNALPDVRINGMQSRRVPNTSNLTFTGIDGMALIARLADRDIVCSQVSACSSGNPEPSRTLLAMGLSSEDAFASARFAFGMDNRLAETERAAKAVSEEVFRLRSIAVKQ